jgi:hypothetical protein
VTTLNANKVICTQNTFPGGNIEARSNQVFELAIEIPSNFLDNRTLTLEIVSGTLNTSTRFPIISRTQINVEEYLNKAIASPQIDFNINVSRPILISSSMMLEVEVQGVINNPNPLDFSPATLSVSALDETGAALPGDGLSQPTIIIQCDTIPAKSGYPFTGKMLMPIDLLDQTELSINASSSVRFLNVTKSIDNTRTFALPELAGLINVPQLTITADTTWTTVNSINMVVLAVHCEFQNDNVFDLTTQDFKLNLYNDSTDALIKSITVPAEDIRGLPGRNFRSLDIKIELTSSSVGVRGFKGLITGDTNIGLAGVNETTPVSGSLVYQINPKPPA